MIHQMPEGHQQQHGHVVYQANPHTVHNLKSVRDHLHQICRKHMNQYVRIETMDGHVYQGVIVNCDKGLLYLQVPPHPHHRQFLSHYYYNTVILPLVLYELLVITLMLL